MKKFIVLLVVIFSMMIGNVYADMEGPNVYNAKMFVSNDEGTVLYDWNLKEIQKLEKDTEIETIGIFESNGETYYSVSAKINDSWERGYLKKEDVSLRDDFVSVEGFLKNDDIRSVCVYKEETYLYKGPNKLYEKALIEEIPVGTNLEYQYTSMPKDYIAGSPEYIYTSYNGVEGWVLIQDLAIIIPEKVLIDRDNVCLYEAPDYNAKKIEIIVPKYTEIDIEYATSNDYNFSSSKEAYYTLENDFVYVEYNGQKGWLLGTFYAKPNWNDKKIITIDREATFHNINGETKVLDNFTELEYMYVSSEYVNNEYKTIYYFMYDGVLSYIYDDCVANQDYIEITSFLVEKEEGIVAYNSKDEEVSLPCLTQIDKVLYRKYNDYNDDTYIIEYNDELLKVSENDFMSYENFYSLYFTNIDMELYETSFENAESICKIPAYSKIVEKYKGKDRNKKYIEYNGINGFIKVNTENDLVQLYYVKPENLEANLKFKIYEINKTVEVSKYEDGESNFINLPANERIIHIFDNNEGQTGEYVDILYKGNTYTMWKEEIKKMTLIKVVDSKELNEILTNNLIDTIETEEISDLENIIEKEKIDEDTSKVYTDKAEVVNEKATPKTTSIAAIIAACIIAITTGVIMLFINKKNQ